MNDWEFQYNGLTLGGVTNYPLNEVIGLSPPGSRVDEVVRMDAHGSFIYAQFLESRTLTLSGEILGVPGTEFASRVNSWRATFAPQTSPLPLSFQLPGEGTRRIYCVPTRRDLPVDFGYNIGQGRFYVELLAEDPRIYEDSLSSASTNVFAPEGADFSIDFNLSFGGGSGGGVFCTNLGSYFSPPIFRFTGPVTNPRVRNKSTAEYVRLSTTIIAGHYIDVNVKDRTVVADGGASAYSYLDLTSTWWELSPGTTEVEFTGTGTTGATLMTIYWRGVWI